MVSRPHSLSFSCHESNARIFISFSFHRSKTEADWKREDWLGNFKWQPVSYLQLWLFLSVTLLLEWTVRLELRQSVIINVVKQPPQEGTERALNLQDEIRGTPFRSHYPRMAETVHQLRGKSRQITSQSHLLSQDKHVLCSVTFPYTDSCPTSVGAYHFCNLRAARRDM